MNFEEQFRENKFGPTALSSIFCPSWILAVAGNSLSPRAFYLWVSLAELKYDPVPFVLHFNGYFFGIIEKNGSLPHHDSFPAGHLPSGAVVFVLPPINSLLSPMLFSFSQSLEHPCLCFSADLSCKVRLSAFLPSWPNPACSKDPGHPHLYKHIFDPNNAEQSLPSQNM